MKVIFIILVSFTIFITIAYSDVVILKPDGTGDYTFITYQFPDTGEHWDKVDDIPHDGDTTKVHTDTPDQQKDAYALEDISLTGEINSVSVYFTFESGTPGDNVWAQPYLRLNSVETAGIEEVEDGYAPYWDSTYSEVIGRPGGGAWIWSDINNLQVCIGLRGPSYGHAICTNVYVEVDYSPTNIEEPNDELPVINQKLIVAPNPFYHQIHVEFGIQNNKNVNIEVYDLSGRQVYRAKVTNNQSVTLEHLKPGIYFLKVEGLSPISIIKLR